MRHTSRSFSRPGAAHSVARASAGASAGASSSQETGTGSIADELNDDSDSRSATSEVPGRTGSASPGHETMSNTSLTATPTAPSVMSGMSGMSMSLPNTGGDGLRRLALAPQGRTHRARAVIVVGDPGAGKSSLILSCQAKWRGNFPVDKVVGRADARLQQRMGFGATPSSSSRAARHSQPCLRACHPS